METTRHDDIRQAVRKAYKKVAKKSIADSGASQATSCCGPSGNLTEAKLGSTCDCGGAALSLEQLSTTIGYTKADAESVPEGSNMGLGCGNPTQYMAWRVHLYFHALLFEDASDQALGIISVVYGIVGRVSE